MFGTPSFVNDTVVEISPSQSIPRQAPANIEEIVRNRCPDAIEIVRSSFALIRCVFIFVCLFVFFVRFFFGGVVALVVTK